MTSTKTKKSMSPTPPKQARARETYEKLLRSTGELLKKVGVEGISTNLIAENAGLTPPAFYRYFSDKHDALQALARRLMDAQNRLIIEMLKSTRLEDISGGDIEKLIRDSIAVTEDFPGGPWVMRTLRAVPALGHVRLESHREMAKAWADSYRANVPGVDHDDIYRRARLGIEIGYAAIELVFDEPELDRDKVARDCAATLATISAAID